MLDNKLIISSLELTGKTMDLVLETKTIDHWSYWHEPYEVISIERFCYYLLSPEFIEKYDKIEYPRVWSCRTCMYFWLAIYEYQLGNEQFLIELLKKICPTDQTM